MNKLLITGGSVLALVAAGLLYVNMGMTSEKAVGPVESGDNVFVSYTANLVDNGELVNEQAVPMKIKIGDGNILHIIDSEIIGMKKGEEKTFVVNPIDGFGIEYDNGLTRVLPAEYFTVGGRVIKKGDTLNLDGKKGVIIGMQGPIGNELITIDLNPLHTYNDIEYSIKVHQIGGRELTPENI